jgi:caa(3)-type oxidase subunit IV
MQDASRPSSEHKRSRIGYGTVFLILVVLTAIELGLGSLGLDRVPRNSLFLLLSLLKAALVAGFFMHLKDDRPLYTYILIIPALFLVVFVLLSSVP